MNIQLKADMHEWFLDKALSDMEDNGGMLESDYEPDCPEEYPSDLSDEYMTLLNKYFSIINRRSNGTM